MYAAVHSDDPKMVKDNVNGGCMVKRGNKLVIVHVTLPQPKLNAPFITRNKPTILPSSSSAAKPLDAPHRLRGEREVQDRAEVGQGRLRADPARAAHGHPRGQVHSHAVIHTHTHTAGFCKSSILINKYIQYYSTAPILNVQGALSGYHLSSLHLLFLIWIFRCSGSWKSGRIGPSYTSLEP